MSLRGPGNRTITLVLASLLALESGTASIALAQDTTKADTRTITVRDTANARQTLFTYRDALLAGAFAGLTIAMFPLDKSIAKRLQIEGNQANRFLDRAATGVEFISSPGALVLGGGLYLTGRVGGFKDLEDLGWHGTEAVLLSTAVTNVAKVLSGRRRPYDSFAVADSNPRDFSVGGGFTTSDRQSFPSGHTTSAFAAASVVTSELRRLYPKSVWVVGPVMYGGATLVGLSRMYHNKHWASDVVLGAAVGTFSGLKVVRYSHAHPDNKLDRFMLQTTLLPDARGGATLAFSLGIP